MILQWTFITNGGLALDMSAAMNNVRIDAARLEVLVQRGAIHTDILAATAPYNLALPWGNGGALMLISPIVQTSNILVVDTIRE